MLPEQFCNGLLIPIIKKCTLDPSQAKSYRPITVSATISKILEYHILECSDFKLSESQFGFISRRSTHMATAIAHDVGSYCLSRGSTLYYCSLDAEGAFDALPHSVLLSKLINVVPDSLWKLLYVWYRNMKVQIRWSKHLSEKIKILRGTRQGGPTSTFIFNVYYKGLVDQLQACTHGVTIKNRHYNTFCYADDVLICSTTVSGLQELINIATKYVSNYGLRFNPTKTNCMILGKNPFSVMPKWYINGTVLNIAQNITYLGSVIGDMNGTAHCNSRTRSAQRSFYALQGAGIKFPGVDPETSLNIYNLGVRSVLVYGCSSVFITRTNFQSLETVQNKCVKLCLGLGRSCHTRDLLNATGTPSVTQTINSATLELLRSCILSDSITSAFYCELLNTRSSPMNNKTLVGRAVQFCSDNDIDVLKYVFNDSYSRHVQNDIINNMNMGNNTSGVIDTIRYLLYYNNYDWQKRNILNIMLKAF